MWCHGSGKYNGIWTRQTRGQSLLKEEDVPSNKSPLEGDRLTGQAVELLSVKAGLGLELELRWAPGLVLSWAARQEYLGAIPLQAATASLLVVAMSGVVVVVVAGGAGTDPAVAEGGCCNERG